MEVSVELTTPLDIGSRLKSLRQNRNLSLRELAKKSTVSVNALSLIERNKTSPTVSTLTYIARALNIEVAAFFLPEDTDKVNVSIFRAKKSRRDGPIEALATNLKNQILNPVLVTMKPGENYKDNLCVHAGDEFIYCLSGEVEIDFGEKRVFLKEGDAATFKGDQPHRVLNSSNEVTVTIVVCVGSMPA